MATKPKASKALAPVAGNNAKSLAMLDQELNQEVANLKDQIGAPSGRSIKLDPAGNFKTPEGMDLGDQFQIVVVDFVSKNLFYDQQYNANNPAPPACYAIGKVIGSMKPEDDSPAKQNDSCVSCPLNVFGSGQGGQSKACKNTRELAVLLVDPENPDAHNAPDAPIYSISVSPTSIKAFDAIVPVIARALGGPPIKAIINVSSGPGKTSTYSVMKFSDPIANPDYAAHVARRGEAKDLLYRHPDFAAYATRAPAARGRQVPARPAPRAAAGRGR